MYLFNNDKREITITKSNPPTPWMNYLSNGTFHTMMSQAGGGVALSCVFGRYGHFGTDFKEIYAYESR